MPYRLVLIISLFVSSALLAACGGASNPTAPVDSATKLTQTVAAPSTVTPSATQRPGAQSTTPPIAPSPTPTQRPPCTNDSVFVADVTVPDGTHLAPGKPFEKTWRIQNTGTCAWDTTYQYRLIGGDALVGQNINLPQTVAPNDTLELTIKMVSPLTAGTYRGQWRLFAPDDTPFGQRPYVEIIVP